LSASINSGFMNKFPLKNLGFNSLNTLKLPLKVHELLEYLRSKDFDVYLVGGFVRDLFCDIESKDLDFILTDKKTLELGKELENKFSGNSFLLDDETQTLRFVFNDDMLKEFTFDFTSVPKDKLYLDLERRDFTFNALAINLKEPGFVIDLFNGINDLKRKHVKAIKLTNLLDDPLRFIRAFRFEALLKGELEESLNSFIKDNLDHFDDEVSVERITVELWKIFDTDNSFSYVKQLADVGLLEKIIPELAHCKKVPPNDHHHLPLFDHSIELVKTFEENYCKIPDWAQEILNKPIGLSSSPKIKGVTKLASILHDIGKPDTWEVKEINGTQKHTFYGHDKLGEEITEKIGERLKFSNAITHLISKLVRYHLRPFQLSQNDAPITSRALYRFFRDVGDETIPLLMLSLADLWATRGPKISEDDLKKNEKLVMYLFDEYKKYHEEKRVKDKKKKLIDGNEVMQITGLKPSPIIGQILIELDEAIAVGEVSSKDEAKDWILKKLSTLK